MSISINQLNKIKELATKNPEFEFIDKDLVQEIDDTLIHATVNDLGEELADVLFVLVCLANQTGVDLEKSFDEKMKKKSERDKTRHISNKKLKS